MRKITAYLIPVFFCLFGGNVSAQNINSIVSVSSGSGYTSNSFLNSTVSEWNRDEAAVFYFLQPFTTLNMISGSRFYELSGAANLTGFSGDRGNWQGGFAMFSFSENVFNPLVINLQAGMHKSATTYHRQTNWTQAGLSWNQSPFMKSVFQAGLNNTSYSGLENDSPSSTNYYYRAGFEYWPSFSWKIHTQFLSDLSNLSNPAESFSFQGGVQHFLHSGFRISLQSGLDRMSNEFQLSDNGMPVGGVDADVLMLEDQFIRTALEASYQVSPQVTVRGSAANLRWLSNQDEEVVTDYLISAGVTYSFRPKDLFQSDISRLEWKHTNESKPAQIKVTYRGDARLYITGSFNNWEEPGIPLKKTGRRTYSTELDLPIGYYEYRIIKIENDSSVWLDLPESAHTTVDAFGGVNGRIIIEPEY